MAWEPGLREKREAGGAQARFTKGTGLWRAPVQNRHSVPCSGGGWGALVQGFLATSPSAHPEPPSRPTCVQTEEPSRVGTDELPVAATALCSHAPGRQGARRLPSPARAPLQGRRGRPVSPAPISRAFRSSSDLSALLWAPPSAAGARIHLGGLCLASRLPSTTAGTQLVSSVQSACSPQLQPVENLKKSQVFRLPGRWQVHAF